MKASRINLDALGMFASTLCMIHCLAFPLLLAMLPMLKFSSGQANSNATANVISTSSNAASSLVKLEGASEKDCCETSKDCCETEKDCCEPGSEGGSVTTASCCSTPTDFWVHVGLLAGVAPLGLVAWGAGYRKHGRLGVLALGLAGVLLLCGALTFGLNLFNGRGEQVMTVMGSICMVSAHLWNRRQCQCCNTPDLPSVVEIDGSSRATPPAL